MSLYVLVEPSEVLQLVINSSWAKYQSGSQRYFFSVHSLLIHAFLAQFLSASKIGPFSDFDWIIFLVIGLLLWLVIL